MSINGINYSPYLYAETKVTLNSAKTNKEEIFSTNSVNNSYTNINCNSVDFSTQSFLNNQVNTSELKKDIEKTKSEQGLIGKLWDGFKNLTGIGAGSNKAKEAIEKFENGEISLEEVEKAVNEYKEGQEQCVDIIADIASGIVSFGVFALATGVGIAASPLTGGASLGLVALGFGIAGATGAASKIAIKGIDAAVGGKKYDSFGYDLATGGINGIFAPVTAGIGGAAGKAIAGKVGVTAIREGGEVILKETLEGGAKGAITKTLLTTNVKYIGGSNGARALVTGTDMAVNGVISGAVDSGTRYLAIDSENKSFEGFMKEVGTGTVSGLILSPVIGGGMRVFGNGAGKLTTSIKSSLDDLKISQITTGRNGIIRGASELNVNDIVRLYNNKMRTVTEADINSFITRYASTEDQAIARELLGEMSQFANLDSLNSLYTQLSKGGITLVAEKNSTSMSDIFAYLADKKAFPKDIVLQANTLEDGIKDIISKNGKAGIILDDLTIQIIKYNSNLQNMIKENPNIRLIAPQGWDSGINAFGYSTNQEITDKLDDLLIASKNIIKNKGVSQTEAIQEVLNSGIINEINALNMADNLDIIRCSKVTRGQSLTNTELSNLYSSSKITAEQLDDILLKYSEEDRQVVLEVLAQTSRPSSMATLSAQTKKQYIDIVKLAKSKRINYNNIYYLIPTVEAGKGKKSYGMVATIFRKSNNVPVEKFITDVSQIPAGNKSMLVILDDFSGSGKSLIDNYRAITNPKEVITEQVTKRIKKEIKNGAVIENIDEYITKNIQKELNKSYTDVIPYNSTLQKYNGEIIIAPLASTSGEGSAIVNFSQYTKNNPKLTFMPADEIPLFFDSDYFKGLSKDQQRLYEEVIKPFDNYVRFDPSGDKASKWMSPNDELGWYGFRGNATSIVFPYMAPNNNNAFYSTFIAPLLTFNKSGVKNRWMLY